MDDRRGRVRPVTTSSHWGTYDVLVAGDGGQGEVVGVRPRSGDPAAAPLMGNVPGAQHHRSRVRYPAVRRGWLEGGPGADHRRGCDQFVRVAWPELVRLLAAELDRVRSRYGNEAIFGGSYGWGSAGRFHHPQSQLHRFLNCIGGYVSSVGTYSHAASALTLPYLLGEPGADDLRQRAVSWDALAEQASLVVSFGGLRPSNTWVSAGGRARQTAVPAMLDAARRGARFVSVSPIRGDTDPALGAEWLALRPGTDVAVMLALLHVLITEERYDAGFLRRCTVGADRVRDYVLGKSDGQPKTPGWAAELAGIPAEAITGLARRMAAGRTLVNVGWSLQRTQFGEQTVWAGLTLAAFLGQIGLPGGGFGHGYGSVGDYGGGSNPLGLPRFSPGRNPVSQFIPVARIADALLAPGEQYPFNGGLERYPYLRLAYWAGGNPFHHHQDLARLQRALRQLDTLVVHETHWTQTARHADIVIPATTTLERDDIGAGPGDLTLRVMPRVVAPPGEARDEYATFCAAAAALGVGREFSEDRDVHGWLAHIYGEWRERAGRGLPDFAQFWQAGELELPGRHTPGPLFGDFRTDPGGHPLATPSGKIELYSATVAAYGYADCPGYAAWLDPDERLGAPRSRQFPLHLIANQPPTRLHSQQDMGEYSQQAKIGGREPLRLHPRDAAARGIRDGDIVRVSNDTGTLLAGAVVTDGLRPGVAQLSTGAWFDPSAPETATCVHGNPNALTRDRGSSALSQGCTGQHVLVEIERYDGPLPPVRSYDPPVY
ncbi:MAG TPA: molybdopterin-dependent oxidoreductase [Trebonia sp.]